MAWRLGSEIEWFLIEEKMRQMDLGETDIYFMENEKGQVLWRLQLL